MSKGGGNDGVLEAAEEEERGCRTEEVRELPRITQIGLRRHQSGCSSLSDGVEASAVSPHGEEVRGLLRASMRMLTVELRRKAKVGSGSKAWTRACPPARGHGWTETSGEGQRRLTQADGGRPMAASQQLARWPTLAPDAAAPRTRRRG